MRTIKFRVWEQNQKRWCWSTEVTLEGSGQVVHHHYPKNGYDYAKDKLPENMIGCGCLAPIQQFTGLLDKNGREIYEGDLLRGNNGRIFEVKWNKLYAAFGLKDHSLGKESAPLRGLHPSSQLEVVSNIYEDPELLQSKTFKEEA
jgi:hypothetical protein